MLIKFHNWFKNFFLPFFLLKSCTSSTPFLCLIREGVLSWAFVFLEPTSPFPICFFLDFCGVGCATSSTTSIKLWAFIMKFPSNHGLGCNHQFLHNGILNPSPFWSCLYSWPWVPPQPMCWATDHLRPFAFKCSPPPNALKEFTLDLRSLL